MMDEYKVVLPIIFVGKLTKDCGCIVCESLLRRNTIQTFATLFHTQKITPKHYAFGLRFGYICLRCFKGQAALQLELNQDCFRMYIREVCEQICTENSKTGSAKAYTAGVIKELQRYYKATLRLMSGNACCQFCEAQNVKKRCKGCMFVKYCNRECAENDWEKHKPLCKWFCSKKSIFLAEQKIEI